MLPGAAATGYSAFSAPTPHPPALVPVLWYRKRVGTSCTGPVLKSGLTSPFPESSMSEVANQPPRFRLTRFSIFAGSRVSRPQLANARPERPLSYVEGQELYLFHRVHSGEAPESRRARVFAACNRGAGPDWRDQRDCCRCLVLPDALESWELQRSPS